MTLLCIASFAIGFIIVPAYNTFRDLDFSNITDSTYVHSNGIDISTLNTPKEGYHTWLSPKGNLYMGIWEEGRLSSGILITDNSVYEGELRDFSPHGYGTMYYNNGSFYRGNWVAGNKEGIGLKHNRDGSRYFGHWRAGLFNTPKDINYKLEDCVYGIDISRYQHFESIKWNELALYSDSQGDVYAYPTDNHDYMHPVTFVFIKATQGITQDPFYHQHMEKARKHHVIVGAYHFFTIGDDIDDQISNFTQHVKIDKGDLPPVLDLENEYSKNEKKYLAELRKYGINKMHDDAIKWLTAIEAYYGVKPIIYTSEVWKKNFLADKRFDSYDFWISRYYNVRPKNGNNWIFWQRTDAAVPHGYNKEIDVNIYNGTYKGFLNYRKSI